MIPLRSTERTYSTAHVVRLLIGLNVLIFLYQVTMDPDTLVPFVERWGIVPDTISQHLYTLFTSMFLHGGWLQVVTNPYSHVPTIGASGAIAGVMGAYLIKFPRARIVTLVPIIIFITTMEIPAWIMLVWWFVIQLFSGFGSLATANYNGGGVAWFAHVGGFVTGMLLIRAFPVKR